MAEPRPVRLLLLNAVLVVAAAAAVGLPSLGHGLVFDDHQLLGGNAPVIKGETSILTAFTYRYWGVADEASPNELYRPVTIASLAVNARIAGGSPRAFHAGNIALHAANALLVWLLLQTLFSRPALALIGGLCFAVHPIATEAVVPISGRADLLATLFVLTGTLLGMLALRKRSGWLIPCGLAVTACALLGALSKESAYAMPLLLAATAGADMKRPAPGEKDRRAWLATVASFGVFMAFGLLMALILRVRILGYLYQFELPEEPSTAALSFVNNPLQNAPPLGRILTALRVAVMGAGLLVFPWQLSADYSFDQIPVTRGWPSAGDLGAVAFLLLFLGLVYWTARRFPVAFFGLTWSALSYLLVSNLLFPIGTIFGERLLYLPLAGFATLVAAGLSRLLALGGRTRAVGLALAALLLGLSAVRFVGRTADWSTDERLFASSVRTSPRSAKALSNYGFTLQRAGRLEEAATAYRGALEIAPTLTGTGISLGRTLSALGQHEEAIARYEEVNRKDSGISYSWSGLGIAQAAAGRYEESEVSFRKALQLSLGGNLEALAGLAGSLAATGREQEAIDLLSKATRALPQETSLRESLGDAHYQLGVRRLKEGDRAAFVAQMREATARDPLHGPAQFNLAVDALERGDTATARAHAAQAARARYPFPDGFLRAVGLEPFAQPMGKTQEPGPTPGS